MRHPARPKRSSKPLVSRTDRSSPTVGAKTATGKRSVSDEPSQTARTGPACPQQVDLHPTGTAPLAGLDLTDQELDMLFCLAVKHHFEQEQVWVPSVLRTMPLLEGINDRTGRRCRIYVRPGRRIVMVETLS